MVKKAAQATPNELLRLARLERGWTQKDVADRIGAPLNLNVNRWERGTSFPSAYYVQRLCEVFGKSASELGLLPSSSPPAQQPSPQEKGSAPPATRGLWNVPFRRNPFFTGRAQLLAALRDQLSQHQDTTLIQTQALSGLGGIGKTQTAVEYACRYRDGYRAVFWARAASHETLVADFVALAHLLELPGQDEQDEMLVVNAVKRWLGQNEGWLLILDNVDDLSSITDFLPTRGSGHVLLTTRAQATGRVAANLSVEKMDVSESILLLLRRAQLLAVDEPLDMLSRTMLSQSQKIARMLDGLPLALEQAGAYIEAVGCSLSDYLVLYERRRLDLLKRQSSLTSADYPHTVASTWALSFEQVEQANPAAAELLRLCAFLDPDAIPEEIFTEGAHHVGPAPGSVVTDPLLFNDAIQTLRRYSLIKRDGEAKLLNMHRLVQVVLKDGMNEAEQRQWAERVVRAVGAAFPEGSFDTWSRCERYLPHMQVCVALIDQYAFTLPEVERLLDRAGNYLCERAVYERAAPLLQRVLTMREQKFGSDHPETARCLNDLATVYLYQGKYEQAEPLYQCAITIREQKLGSDHPDLAESINDLAALYEYQGKYNLSESLNLRALAIREQTLGPDHLDVAESLNNLAMIYDYQGRYSASEPLHLRALAIREWELRPTHPRVANGLNNLGWLYFTQGKYVQAEPFYQRALSIREEGLGLTHPRTAMSMDNLARLYTAQGKYEQAEPLHQRALTILEQALDPEHPAVASALHHLAHLYHLKGEYAQAESLYQRALSIDEQKSEPNLPRVAQNLHSMAQLFEVQGKYEQASPLYRRALAIREQVLGPEHPDMAQIREDYANFLRKTQQKVASGVDASPLLENASPEN